MLSLFASIQAFLKSVELYLKYLPWILLVVVSVVTVSGIKSCQKERDARIHSQEVFTKTLRSTQDKHQESEILATTKYQRDIALKDDQIASIMDSLKIKNRQIISLKSVGLGKTITKIVPEYDTLYELIEVGLHDYPESFSLKLDNCLTVSGKFTPQGLEVTGNRDIEIYDFNYTKRRNLFGLKWTPRLGRKEVYQTLVTNCGDTITHNQKITFRE